MIENQLKKKLGAGYAAAGIFMTCDAPDFVEIAALSGFDFVILDSEHGAISPGAMPNMIRAAELRGITPIVRIPDHQESTVLHYLDIGAHGLQVPQVNDTKTAKDIIRFGKYAPVGERGVAFPRASDYGIGNMPDYFVNENQQTLFAIQCENEACLARLDEICSLPEVDVIFFGPYDMSQSMGITGQVTHPRVEQAAQTVLEACRRSGKIAGIYCGDGETAKLRAQQGLQYLAIGMDTVLFSRAGRQEILAFRNQ